MEEMSRKEVEDAVADLQSRMSPETLDFLRKRAAGKGGVRAPAAAGGGVAQVRPAGLAGWWRCREGGVKWCG